MSTPGNALHSRCFAPAISSAGSKARHLDKLYGTEVIAHATRATIPPALLALAAPASAQLSSQQQRMKDCNAQASGMTESARKQFMSSCFSGGTAAIRPHCINGKPCGNSCIAKDKVCHQQDNVVHPVLKTLTAVR